MTKIKKSLTLNVSGNSYEVKQPSVGQIIDIEMMKAQITNGNYGKMIGNFSQMSVMSLDMIDMFAHFKILCPKLLKDLAVENWADLDAFDTMDMFKAYMKQFKPWYSVFSEKLTEVWQSVTDSLVEKEESATNEKE